MKKLPFINHQLPYILGQEIDPIILDIRKCVADNPQACGKIDRLRDRLHEFGQADVMPKYEDFCNDLRNKNKNHAAL